MYRSNASNDLVSSSDLLMQNPASLGMVVTVVPCWATNGMVVISTLNKTIITGHFSLALNADTHA